MSEKPGKLTRATIEAVRGRELHVLKNPGQYTPDVKFSLAFF